MYLLAWVVFQSSKELPLCGFIRISTWYRDCGGRRVHGKPRSFTIVTALVTTFYMFWTLYLAI
uniref:Uncharacterized protein n=1 Tax=Helianthus annuus TaxID=4232 RepID=A0A251RX59_HELAN